MSNIYDFDSNNQDSAILNGDSVENHQQEVDSLLNEFPSLRDLDSAPFTAVQLAFESMRNAKGFREYED